MEVNQIPSDIKAVLTPPSEVDKIIKGAKHVHLLLIDCQQDFVIGNLKVDGAVNDMKRIAGLIEKHLKEIEEIHVTMDSHTRFDIAHPLFWKDEQGNHPPPFTRISLEDVENRKWVPVGTKQYKRVRTYIKELERRGRYQHTIWPEHCLIGSTGQSLDPTVLEAIHKWEALPAKAHYIVKGVNPFTEHYSAVAAEVPDPEDVTTQVNIDFLQMLERADVILVGGEASSHCVLSTVTDILDNAGTYASKVVLLLDAMSPVPGCEKNAEKFFLDAHKRGVRLATTGIQVLGNSSKPLPPQPPSYPASGGLQQGDLDSDEFSLDSDI